MRFMNDDNVVDIKPNNPNGFNKNQIVFSIIGFLFVLFLMIVNSLFFTIDTQEEGVILRFGKYHRTVGPGLHFKLPNLGSFLPIEEVIKVPVTVKQKLEFGFKTVKAGIRSQYRRSSNYSNESTMLTGDLNVAEVEYIIQYRISDAKKFLFNVRNVKNNLYDLANAVIREVIGDRTVSEVLTEGRNEIATESLKKMQTVVDSYKMGIRIEEFKLQNVNPPNAVKPSFNEVNSAEQEANQAIQDAKAKYNKVIPEAEGKAEKEISDAKAYAKSLTNKALGDTNRFLSFYKEYKKAPEVTKKRLYFETMQQVLGNDIKLILIDKDVKTILPTLNLNSLKED